MVMSMSEKIELLAPAGTWEALEAAVNAGADAVYLGGTKFGARAFAGNFDRDAMLRAVTFAHRRNVRIYVTVNTLFTDAETESLVDELVFLYSAGVDALIVQDLGVVRLARRLIPDMPLHASTQMTITNSAGARFASRVGMCRVVPARELSLNAWRSICTQGVETEAFIHGALCMCYSGQCLMSSMIGGRSGNRGRCAQPCRMEYDIVDSRGRVIPFFTHYPLSTKDLNTLGILPELADAGVFSFKIEGRMKRPEYVAVVTQVYRRAFDSWLSGRYSVSEHDRKDAEQIFNRGFTTAYLEGCPREHILSGRRPGNRGVKIGRVKSAGSGRAAIKLELDLHKGDGLDFGGSQRGTNVGHINVKGEPVTSASAGSICEIPAPRDVQAGRDVFRTYDKELMERAAEYFGEKNLRRIQVNAVVTGAAGAPVTVTFTDNHGISGTGVTNVIAEDARTRPLDDATLCAQLGRLGTTDYSLEKLESCIEGKIIVPLSSLNEARRQAIEALDTARLESFAPLRTPLDDNTAKRFLQADREERARSIVAHEPTMISVWADTIDKVRAACEAGAGLVIFGGDRFASHDRNFKDYATALQICRKSQVRIAMGTPRIVSEESLPAFTDFLRASDDCGADEIRIHNVGSWQLSRELGLKTPLWADISLNIANSQSLAFWAEERACGATLSCELNISQVKSLAKRSPLPLECVVHGAAELMVTEFPLASIVGHGHIPEEPIFLRDRTDAEFPIMTDQFGRTHILNSRVLCALELAPRLSEAGISSLRIDARAMTPSETFRITSLYKDALCGKLVRDIPGTTRGHYSRGVE